MNPRKTKGMPLADIVLSKRGAHVLAIRDNTGVVYVSEHDTEQGAEKELKDWQCEFRRVGKELIHDQKV